ncbi:MULTISPECIES: tetratricopeptide repeat protein [unclassified Bradyrhizobium]|uniref:tetratricopeptide repeat protein n=1 Tax=unclassified Bradyrhizobium TaxID=2631580 RepID=UPI002449C66C|nr:MULTISPECIES: tetratricopeptide repeat protein [unclassified Bradyrhizobium]MDH2344188.1 tetratricopeptide repeat protein [Bradyrhizobium sp. SSUT77]MDH2356881.1 tetratricopeptide repeat protein [Bradyrhizobium sp. SSUT112]
MTWVSRIAAVHSAFWIADRWYRIWWIIWPAALTLLISGWIYLDKPTWGESTALQGNWAKPIVLATPIPTRNSPILANWPEKLHNDVAACFTRAPDINPIVEACSRLIDSGEIGNPQRSSAYNQRGFLRRVKDPARALEDVEAALKLMPNVPYALTNRAFIYIGQSKFDAALQDLNKAVEQFPPMASGPAHHLRGIAYFKLGDYQKAQIELDEALRVDPNNPDPLMGRGELEQAQKNNDAALRDFDEYSRRVPRDPRGLIGRATVLETTGHPQEALAALDGALAIDPSNLRAATLRDRIRKQGLRVDPSKPGDTLR